MALLFSEEFETTLGQPPVGWDLVINTATVTTGGYHNQGCLNFGRAIRHSLPSHVTSASLFYAVKGATEATTHFTAEQKVVVGTITSYSQIAKCIFGQDRTLMVVDGAGNVVCSGRAAFTDYGEQSNFTFLQLDLTIGNTTIGTSSALSVACTARVNGEVLGVGTSSFLSSLSTYYDSLRFDGGEVLDSIYQYDAILAAPITTPNQGTNINARVSQAVLEWLGLPSSIDARLSQAVIEHADLPDSANVRISQCVIELITVGGNGWYVYEA